MTESTGTLPLVRGARMPYSDESPVAFWRRRELEERALAKSGTDEARAIHTKLADHYAGLISIAPDRERKEA